MPKFNLILIYNCKYALCVKIFYCVNMMKILLLGECRFEY